MVKSSYQKKKENTARVVGSGLPISTKDSLEICNFIKRKNTKRVKADLEKVIDGKLVIPFKKYTQVAHKKGVGPGKTPIKACKEFLSLVKEIEANAQYKGVSGDLKIVHACANKASTPWHFGRKRRRKTKRTNVEIIVEETKKKVQKEKKKAPKEVKQESKKIEEPKAKEENKKPQEEK